MGGDDGGRPRGGGQTRGDRSPPAGGSPRSPPPFPTRPSPPQVPLNSCNLAPTRRATSAEGTARGGTTRRLLPPHLPLYPKGVSRVSSPPSSPPPSPTQRRGVPGTHPPVAALRAPRNPPAWGGSCRPAGLRPDRPRESRSPRHRSPPSTRAFPAPPAHILPKATPLLPARPLLRPLPALSSFPLPPLHPSILFFSGFFSPLCRLAFFFF